MTTIICDIDGVLVYHSNNPLDMKIVSGTLDKLIAWQKKGYNLILITGRRESMRGITELQLENAGIAYDQLIMGIGSGRRYLINDMKPDFKHTALVVNLERDEGISKVDI